ncbi:ISNCY family transposase [Mesorhizobium sp. ESP6-5]|uniref:ISNCY family transposase n=1 Tax=Mesorhizobium sp. ESP6-5 TaxID=2876623 RepID=UPI001CCFB75A|nr:ISNCY family transposase [Mesorhizobium sp. ESP6-5]MBZ9754569.1 ISNCY family transposase [Mesorhizobium sp. ESP6-5]
MQKFRDVLSRWNGGDLSMMEAGELLGMSERQFRRYRDRYEEAGEAGLLDRRLGKLSTRRVPAEAIEEMLELYRHRYLGWNVKHFHEHLLRDHHFSWGYTSIKTQLHAAGLVERAKRRGAHRRKRERKPCEGMMLHQDGSRHRWLAGEPMLDLIVTMDDATSTIYSAFLIEEEGTASSFQGLLETFVAKGLPSSLYTDRGSHYFVTLKAGEAVDKSRLTQVGRALRQLGIEHIPAYSPEARGRSERMFSTLQDRLRRELALAGIADIEAANRFIAQTYLPAHNARFARPPAIEDSAFVVADPRQLAQILCIEEERVVAATTRSPSRGCDYSCRTARSGITSSKPRSGSGSTRMAPSQSSTGRDALLDTALTAPQSKKLAPLGKPREPLRRKNRSGQMISGASRLREVYQGPLLRPL